MPDKSIINSAFINSFHRIVREVGDFIRSESKKVKSTDIEVKKLNSLVSYVDKEAERRLVKELSELLPDSGFITEEDTVDDENHDHVWIIDPLDGTTNYLQGLPHYCVSVALAFSQEVVLAAIYDPEKNELFHAGKDHGAWLGETKISCSSKENLSEAILVTGFPYAKTDLDAHVQLLKYFLENGRGVRRYGSAALDLCYVACGRYDAYYEYQLNIWDLAAGALIAEEAGAIVSDYKGSDNHLQTGQILSSNRFLHKTISEILQEFTS